MQDHDKKMSLTFSIRVLHCRELVFIESRKWRMNSVLYRRFELVVVVQVLELQQELVLDSGVLDLTRRVGSKKLDLIE